jgi:hypothetical protein
MEPGGIIIAGENEGAKSPDSRKEKENDVDNHHQDAHRNLKIEGFLAFGIQERRLISLEEPKSQYGYHITDGR